MTLRDKPPFRADHVGSLLRPKRLLEARDKFLGAQTADQNLGPHDNADLRAVEDECIKEVIALQEAAGLQAATDGEFRRRSWWLEMVMNWDGFTATRKGPSSPFVWKDTEGKKQDFSVLTVSGKIAWRESPVVKALSFLKDNTSLVPKVTMPAPSVVHCFAGGDPAILAGSYDDMDEFWGDLTAAYRAEIAALVDAGARYIQIDDVSLPFLCDPDYDDVFRSWGSSTDAMLDQYAKRINQALDGAPDDVTFTMHQCRGNREGLWAAEGGYDRVADVMFNQINVDGYFLEYDTPRAGTFEPLRFLPEGKVVALGLVSSKSPALEDKDALKRRIDDAAVYTPLDRLALAPQCGFASSIAGNPLSEDDEKAKLALIVDVANDVWSGA
jgi:5-methyltetrahydropteroyltriglutamate--homocysteine methyltransferase